MWFAKLSNIPLELRTVRLDRGEHKSEQFLKISPEGKVPVLVDNDLTLIESQAIVHYLRRKYNVCDLYPESQLQLIAKVDSYLAWHNNHFRPGVATYGFTFIGPRSFGVTMTSEQVEKAKRNCHKVIQTLNQYWLASDDSSFIGGSPKATIADIFAYSELAQLLVLLDGPSSQKLSQKQYFDEFAHVKKWLARMEQLNDYDSVHKVLYHVVSRWKATDSKL